MLRIVVIILWLTFMAAGCVSTDEKTDQDYDDNNRILSDLAFDSKANNGYEVYIEEEGKYNPYYVLTKNYNGNCLLLRKFLLDDNVQYDYLYSGRKKPSYYPESYIDTFLCRDFVNRFPETIQDSIQVCDIAVTSFNSIGTGGKNISHIKRKVFLLSYSEVNGESSRTNVKEGDPIEYFRNRTALKATFSDGTPGSWWLRTPNTGDRIIVCGVSADGDPGIGGIYSPDGKDTYKNGVRPALCLPGEMPVKQIRIEGISCYTIE